MNESREERLMTAFSSLAAVLTEEYDVVGLLDSLVQESVALLGSQAGALLLADSAGGLHLTAATDEKASFVEMMQIETGIGPCVECISTGQAVSVADIAEVGEQWAAFRDTALEQGYRSMQATPLRLRGRTVGGMNLFRSSVGAFDERDAAALQTLTDVAAIGIMQQNRLEESNRVAEQLQSALDSRILIEQAKGVVAHAASVDVDEAFRMLRAYARGHSVGLRVVAAAVIEHGIDVTADAEAVPLLEPPGRGQPAVAQPDRTV
jgi:GAF domain-containing protein